MKIICVKDNISNCSDCYRDMLMSNRVSVLYKSQKQLKQISKGDLILLYHNKWRVIAVGFAISAVLRNKGISLKDCKESYVYVNWIFKANDDLKNSINYKKISDSSPPPPTVSPVKNIKMDALFSEISKNQNILD